MAEKPILFSAPMVRAILEGRKTQTRRVVKLLSDPPERNGDRYDRLSLGCWHVPDSAVWENEGGEHFDCRPAARCPYPIGTRLWVRETWKDGGDGSVYYRVDRHMDVKSWPWRPSIFMPRWASRITLEVTDIRVQQVQEISEEDALAEGTQEPSLCELGGMLAQAAWSERQVYQRLWDFINAKRGFGWAVNPWVFAYTFKEVSRG